MKINFLKKFNQNQKMPKRNLIFLTLLISVLMVSVVSAGITGYLVSRGGGIADAGYTATLQKVEGTTAIVSVQTPTGTTEVVRVAEGETARVGTATISASDLTRGTLFRRSGANVEINVPEEGEGVPEPKGCEKVTLQKGDLFGEEYSWESIYDNSGKFLGIIIHFGGDIGDIKILSGETIVVSGNSITLFEIGNFEAGENWVILSVCPKKPTEPTPKPTSCQALACEWKFNKQPIQTNYDNNLVKCGNINQIAIAGSCRTDDQYASAKQSGTIDGTNWLCGFENTGSTINPTGYAGVLCCLGGAPYCS